MASSIFAYTLDSNLDVVKFLKRNFAYKRKIFYEYFVQRAKIYKKISSISGEKNLKNTSVSLCR